MRYGVLIATTDATITMDIDFTADNVQTVKLTTTITIATTDLILYRFGLVPLCLSNKVIYN